MEIKLNVTDNKMLDAIDRLVNDGKERYKKYICESIGLQPQTLRNIRIGKQHFTAENIRLMAEKYQVNPNYIFGYDTVFYRSYNVSKKVNSGQKKTINLA